MILRLLALLFAASVVVSASQPPTSKGRQPVANASQADKPATDDPRGTNASPLVVVVQPTTKTDAETAQEQAQKNDQASDRRWTRGLAIVTTIVGLFQLVAIGFQVGIALRQNRIIKRQNRIMSRQRMAADTQTGYMEAGLKVARDSADAATNAANAASVSATIGQRTFEIDAAARIDVGSPVRHTFGTVYWVRIPIVNTGRVAAINVCPRVYQQWLVLPINNEVPSEQFETILAIENLLPNVPTFIQVDLWQVARDKLAGFNKSTSVFTVALFLTYQNGFGQTVASRDYFTYNMNGTFDPVPRAITVPDVGDGPEQTNKGKAENQT